MDFQNELNRMSKQEKYSEYKECPDCKSKRITKFLNVDALVGINVQSGKIIYQKKEYWKGATVTLVSYRCRKCGWNSDPFVI